MKPKILLFDIDGTLLLTGSAGRIAFESAFGELYGIPHAWGSITPHGKTDLMIIRELVRNHFNRDPRDEEYGQIRDRYIRHFEREIQNSSRFRLMPGVAALLENLSGQKSMALGLATGNFEATAYEKLRRGSLDTFFGFGGFGSDAEDRSQLTRIAYQRGQELLRKKVPPQDVFVIGDTPQDVLAGKSIGAKTVAVMTNHSSREDFEQSHADHIFQNLTDIPAFLKAVDS